MMVISETSDHKGLQRIENAHRRGIKKDWLNFSLNNSHALVLWPVYFLCNIVVLRDLAVRLPLVVTYLPAYRHVLFF